MTNITTAPLKGLVALLLVGPSSGFFLPLPPATCQNGQHLRRVDGLVQIFCVNDEVPSHTRGNTRSHPQLRRPRPISSTSTRQMARIESIRMSAVGEGEGKVTEREIAVIEAPQKVPRGQEGAIKLT